MKKSRNVLFCVIFPANLRFIDEFINSVNVQTTPDFDVFFVNDGVDLQVLESVLQSLKRSFKIYTITDASCSFAKIREIGIKALLPLGYENIIFTDTDDLMSDNRIRESVDMLDRYPVVFNDLSLIDIDRHVIKNKIWSGRLASVEIRKRFLLEKNVLGFGNTAMKANLLHDIAVPDDIKAADWFVFYHAISDLEAKFMNHAETYYRQYDSNSIGVGKVTEERIRRIIEVKRMQYKYLPEEEVGVMLQDLDQIEKQIVRPEYLESVLAGLNSRGIEYFWWEETNYIDPYKTHIPKL